MFDSIYVELNSRCNMACEFCVQKVMSRPKKLMDFDLFTKVIDQIVANDLTKHIRLAAVGESLLYPQLSEAIRYCSERKLKTSMITNSLGLTTAAYQNLINSGLNELQISLQDLSEDSFAYRHAQNKTNYASFYSNIIGLINYHLSRDISANLIINLLFCKRQWIESELWELTAIKENTQHAAILLKPFIAELNQIANNYNIESQLNAKEVDLALRSLNVFEIKKIQIMKKILLYITSLNPQLFYAREKLGGRLGKKIKLVKGVNGRCFSFQTPMILSDGSFVPCCVDALGELNMGRINANNSLISIINGEKYQNLRKGFEKRKVIDPVCRECRGRLTYKNPMLQVLYLIRSFNLYAVKNKIRDRMSYYLRKIWQK